MVVGKGAALGKAEMAVRKFIRDKNLPFLATPMGKGGLMKGFHCYIMIIYIVTLHYEAWPSRISWHTVTLLLFALSKRNSFLRKKQNS